MHAEATHLKPSPDSSPARVTANEGLPRAVSRVVVLTSGTALAHAVVNALASRLGPLVVIEEAGESKAEITRRRARRLGRLTALGQNALALPLRFLFTRRRRLREIRARHAFKSSLDAAIEVHRVESVNSPECCRLLKELAPEVVAVYSTRVLSGEVLGSVAAPFINYHAGITPMYRGQDPAYWALVAGDAENAGVTIHLIDRGVDTGAILYQERVTFSPADNISTYQHVQAAAAIPLFARAIEDALDGRLEPRPSPPLVPSRHWYPPTLWGYLANGLRRGVW